MAAASTLTPLAVLALAVAPLRAQVVDQSQPSTALAMKTFSQTGCAQSFRPAAADLVGAGIHLDAVAPGNGVVTLEVWDGLPAAGGSLIAAGSSAAVAGEWVDVLWQPVAVTPGATYYLRMSCTNPSLQISGDVTDPYPRGMVFANAGFQPFPDFDYSFRTFRPRAFVGTLGAVGSCPGPMTLQVGGLTPGGTVVVVYGRPGFYLMGAGPCAGNMLRVVEPRPLVFGQLDGNGDFAVTRPVPAAACGVFRVQAFDFASCAISPPLLL